MAGLIPLGGLVAATDITLAANIARAGSRSEAAVDKRIEGVAADIISADPTLAAAAEAALGDAVEGADIIVGSDERAVKLAPLNIDEDRFVIGAAGEGAIIVRKRGDVSMILAPDSVIPPELLGLPSVVDGPVNPARLRWLRMLTRRLAAGDAGTTLDVMLIGDSYTHARVRWSGSFWDALATKFGDAGIGWVGFSYPSGNTALRNGSAHAGVTITEAGAWTANYYGTRSADLGEMSSSEVGATITITFPAGQSSAKLHYIAAAGATVTYKWGSGAETPLNLTGTAGTLAVATLAPPSAADTVLTVKVTAGTVTLCGVDLRNTGDGIRVHKVAATGSQAQHWATASATASWRTAVAAINPDVVIVMHGANDQSANRTPEQFAASMEAILAGADAALGQGGYDRFVVMQPENQLGKPVLMASYSAATRPVAQNHDAAFLDTQPYFGANPADYAAGSPRPWFSSDNLHPDPATGGRVLADAILRAVLYS